MIEIEKVGIPKRDVRTLDTPGAPVNGVMSFGRLDFEIELRHALSEIGAKDSKKEEYIQGLRHGSVLVLASGSDQVVEAAAQIVNRKGAVDLEKSSGPEADLSEPDFGNAVPTRDTSLQAGRIREGAGAHLFVW